MSPIIFVTGKGGVGKSFVAALLARQLALKGRKTLLVETGGWSYLQDALALTESVQFKPQKTRFGFEVALWSGEDCLREYVQYLIKIPWVGSQFMNNSWLKSLIQVAPGLREIAFLGKLTSKERQHGPLLDYDHIIVDAPSTGHFLALLRAPIGWSSAIKVGPVHTQCQSILSVLNDTQKVQTFLVTLPEPLVVDESQDLAVEFRQVLKSSLLIIANRMKTFPNLKESSVSIEFKEFQEQLVQQQKDQQEQSLALQEAFGDFLKLPFYYQSLENVLEGMSGSQSIF